MANFCTPSHLVLSIGVITFESRKKSFTDPKTTVFVAVHGEDFVILAYIVLTQYRSVTDGRTDGQTDGRLDDG